MTNNSILQELYAVRAEIMAEYGNDLGAYLRDAAQRNRDSDHPVAQIKQRTVRCTGVANSSISAMENPSIIVAR